MKRLATGFLLSTLAALGMVTALPAATIELVSEVGPEAVDPDYWYYWHTNPALSGLGSAGYMLNWSSVGGDGKTLMSDGQPTREPQQVQNPDWLDFTVNSGGSGPNGPGGGGGGEPPDFASTGSYTLGNNLGGEWEMDFSILLFDPDVADDAIVSIQLLGGVAGTDNEKTRSYSAEQIRKGVLATWHIEADAGELVDVNVGAAGDETYPAGFFIDNVVVVPEPATLALLACGAAFCVRKRRSR